jgi:hypothetical protein
VERHVVRRRRSAQRQLRPDCDQLNPAANGECGAWSDQNFGRPRLSTRNAPDSLTGFNKQFYNWQASVTFQHELTQGWR